MNAGAELVPLGAGTAFGQVCEVRLIVGQRVGVDVERHGRVPVTELLRHPLDRFPGLQAQRRERVTERVESQRPNSLGESPKSARQSWRPWKNRRGNSKGWRPK